MIYLESMPKGHRGPLKLWTDGEITELWAWLTLYFKHEPIPWYPDQELPHFKLARHLRRRARIAGAVDAQPVLFLQCQRNLKPNIR